jgi:hypothetical protein
MRSGLGLSPVYISPRGGLGLMDMSIGHGLGVAAVLGLSRAVGRSEPFTVR